jgi:cytochrome c553
MPAERLAPAPLLVLLALVPLAMVQPALDGAAASEPAATPMPADADGVAFFEAKVRPILVDKCYRCHSAEAKKLKGGLYLDSRAGLLTGGDTGPAIVPGDAERSLLIKAVRYGDPDLQMPPKERLPPEAVAALAAWIARGAPDPRTAPPAGAKKGVDYAAAREHWAYRPLATPALPAVKDAAWARTPIDRFVLARLEAAGLKPAPPASRRALIRRLSFDLAGLPPSPEEVDAFIADPAPDAVERLVDGLLASPAFGERWARHWLDLARFAESHGYEQDYDRPFAYHYRDFVIQAFDRDLPYDTFVSWQLAGDELAPDDNLAMMATGFIAAGVWPTQITKNEVEKARYDALDDMLSTTFTAMLGTTVGCARCHDHKYDPISQRDYYRLLSTFTTTVRSEVERDFSPPDYRARRAAFDAAHAPFEQAVARCEADDLPRRLADAGAGLGASAVWTVLPGTLASAGGAGIAALDDGSFLASGANPEHDAYTLTATTDQVGITALRLEALAHASLPKSGPGRAGNGNFALTGFSVTAAPLAGGEPVAVELVDARATFAQSGLPAKAAIDHDRASGWAVDPQVGRDHAVVFTCARPIGFPGGTRLVATMHFDNNTGHGIGRPRLSATAAPAPAPLDGGTLTPGVAAALRIPAAQRTAAQQAELIAWYRPLDPEWKRLRAAADAHLAQQPKPTLVKVMIGSEGVPAIRLHTQGGDFLPETHLLKRGDPNLKQEVVTPSFWPILMGAGESRWQSAPPPGAHTSYRRRALAAWMVDTEQGAGRLLARVVVNRLWQHLLGRGLAPTPSDVGLHAEPPTHPELLDWLAGELIRGGWRLKPIIRAIALSSVYGESTVTDAATVAADPQDALLSRFHRRRLEAEAIRDTLMAIGGVLDRTRFGPGTLDQASRRRSIYFTIKRSALIPFLTVFDLPEPLQGVAERPATTIAPQALALLNGPQARAWAAGFAARIATAPTAEAAVDAAYRLALARLPSAAERADGTAFIAAQESVHADQAKDAHRFALTDFCQVLMCLNETIYVE